MAIVHNGKFEPKKGKWKKLMLKFLYKIMANGYSCNWNALIIKFLQYNIKKNFSLLKKQPKKSKTKTKKSDPKNGGKIRKKRSAKNDLKW